MIILTNTGFASNWSFVGRTSKEDNFNLFGATYTEYVDKSSAMKDGDSLVFWSKQQFDKDDEDSGEMILTQNEVIISMQKARTLATYEYNHQGKETSHNTEPSGWLKYNKGSQFAQKNVIALKYAKDGKDTGAKPTP